MNKLILLTISILALFMTSCADITNEVWVNKDGSGKVDISMDMGEMMGMIEMMASMEEGMKDGEESEEDSDTDEGEDEEDMFSMLGMSGSGKMENVDTSFNFYDVMPDSIRNKLENPELFRKMSMTTRMNKEESEMFLQMSFEYDSPEERDEIINSIGQLSEKGDENAEKINQFKEMMRQYDADLEKGIVTIPEQDFSSEFAEDMGGEEMDMDFDNMSEEDMAMMQMMMGDAGFITTMHLPDEIISCDDKSAEIDGNTITIKDSYMDLMKNKKFAGRTIKFKVD